MIPARETMEPVGFDPSAPTDEEASAPDQGEEFSEVDITLRAVQPEELGFASVDEMHRAVRAGLGIDDDRPIHVGHDKKGRQGRDYSICLTQVRLSVASSSRVTQTPSQNLG